MNIGIIRSYCNTGECPICKKINTYSYGTIDKRVNNILTNGGSMGKEFNLTIFDLEEGKEYLADGESYDKSYWISKGVLRYRTKMGGQYPSTLFVRNKFKEVNAKKTVKLFKYTSENKLPNKDIIMIDESPWTTLTIEEWMEACGGVLIKLLKTETKTVEYEV